jgi:hypothetical protein
MSTYTETDFSVPSWPPSPIGGCPECGGCDGSFWNGPQLWGCCREHEVRWCLNFPRGDLYRRVTPRLPAPLGSPELADFFRLRGFRIVIGLPPLPLV